MNHSDFLLEIGCEELPPRYQQQLVDELKGHVEDQLNERGLEHGPCLTFSTPRRLALLIRGLVEQQPPQKTQRLGPSQQAAYDKMGTPTMACIGFASSCGVSVDQLEVIETPKGGRVSVSIEKPGIPTKKILLEMVEISVNKLAIPKPMRWGAGDLSFIRPVHWVLMLFGREVIPGRVVGIESSQKTYGHRFMYPRSITITEPKEYGLKLYSQGNVIADFNSRRKTILKQMSRLMSSGKSIINDEALLNETTALVEWPVTMIGGFDERFLSMPREVLLTSLKKHQKAFAVEDGQARLQPYFVVVSNIESRSPDAVVQGNERVIDARLNDADFFFKNDLRYSLESRCARINRVVFQEKLGSVGDKCQRLRKLILSVAQLVTIDGVHEQRAAQLSKCDLVSEMVVEFPDLQGIMGGYYASHDGESLEVVTAIKEQYQPRFAKDVIPQSLSGKLLALVDRLDTVVGIVKVQGTPTGDKDPFGLRRAALGILRIIIEGDLPLDLKELIQLSADTYKKGFVTNKIQSEVLVFIMTRLKAWYQEQGITPQVFAAVDACAITEPLDFHQRIMAVQQFQGLPDAHALCAANKRVSKLLEKQKQSCTKFSITAELLDSDAEKQLAEQIRHYQDRLVSADSQHYDKILLSLAELKQPIDDFFDHTMVMDEDKNKRANRLAMLASVRALFMQVADISLL